MATICLNMIVKNKGAIIKATLANICQYMTIHALELLGY